MSDAERKNKIYMTAEKKAGEYFDSEKVEPIYKKELKSRNPNPKTPKSDMKKDVVPERMQKKETTIDKVKMAKGGRVNLRGGGICKKGMNKKAYGANS